MLDVLLIILGIIFVVTGILGCVLPVIPGPPISFFSLVLLHFTSRVQYTPRFLFLMLIIALIVTVLDYIVPIWGTKRYGGSKKGIWGATIGLLIGLFIGPVGIILGPFAGAVIGESIDGKDSKNALRAGFGAFMGFMMGIGMKLVASGFMTYYFFKELIKSFF